VLGPLTVFQILSIVLFIYALAMLATSGASRHERAVLA
jgi:hypothetical protein